MRDIKFRAWDIENKKMLSHLDIEEWTLHNISDWEEFYNIMQYTGLKDSKGKEIFEGDVLKVPEDWDIYGFMAGEEREVYFNDGGFRFKPIDKGNGRGHHLEDNGEFEIIGNIYENPNLIIIR